MDRRAVSIGTSKELEEEDMLTLEQAGAPDKNQENFWAYRDLADVEFIEKLR